MQSVWTDFVNFPNFKQLKKDIHTDVLIIGGGITGVLCAYQLQQSGVDYVLVEAEHICNGITKNTTAKITSQHGLIYHKLIQRFGVEKARMYLDANETALREYRKLCKSIDCSFESKNSYVYSLGNSNKIAKELHALRMLGFHAEYETQLPLPFSVAGAVKFKHQAQFNSLKFLSEISKGLNIYEHTKVQELAPNLAVTEHGKITAKNIIVTTHFPFLNKHGSYFLKMYQHRSYVIAYKNAPNVDGMYVDESLKGLSFRNYKNMLLIGGGDHRTGKHGGNWQELSSFAETHYPNAKEVYRWATQDCMTLDEVPYIGQYSRNTPSLYVAPVFSPSRSILHPQLIVNAFEATTNLLTPTPKRCAHLGCALKWNPVERTWDCPCHGSRFTHDGQLIDNPSTDDLKK